MHPRSLLTALSTLGLLAAGADARRRPCSSVFPSSAVGPAASSSTVLPPTSGFVTSTRASSDVASTSAVASTTSALSTSSAGASSTVSSTSAQATSTNKPTFNPIYTPTNLQELTIGQTIDITWGYDPAWAGTIEIKLIGGSSQLYLVPLGTIAANLDNSLGKFSWTLDQSFIGSNALYGLTMTFQDGTTVQYSMPFHISSGDSTPSATTTNPATPSATAKPVFDPVYTPTNLQELTFGQTIDITWGYDAAWAGTIKISLIGGESQFLQMPLGEIASNVDNSLRKYSWTINNSFVGAKNIYGLVLTFEDGVTFQYSMPFHISGRTE